MVGQAAQHCYLMHRHQSTPLHKHGLKEKGEAVGKPLSGCLHQTVLAVAEVYAENFRMQVALLVEEIHTFPSLQRTVV
jgi:hypothetical protein